MVIDEILRKILEQYESMEEGLNRFMGCYGSGNPIEGIIFVIIAIIIFFGCFGFLYLLAEIESRNEEREFEEWRKAHSKLK